MKKKKRRIANWEEVLWNIKGENPRKLSFLFSELSKGRSKFHPYRNLNGHLKILCPFHKERTPSLVYYPGTCSWCCYGCGARGTIIDYYMGRKGVAFFRAVIDLAKIFEIKINWESVP